MQKPFVSVIVPTRNSNQILGQCLSSIKNQTYKNIELIVVDNNSTDNTKEIASKFTDKVFNKGPERSAQRNFGARNTAGSYFLFIDSDMKLSESVVGSCVKKMQEDQNLKTIVIPEESFGKGFWAQCKKLERSFYIGIDWMEAARFFKEDVFVEMNGYDESLWCGEDYDLPQRIEAKYGKEAIGRVGNLIYHNEGEISLIKMCKKKFYYGRNVNNYKSVQANVEKFKKQSSIFERYRLLLCQPIKLLKNPIVSLGMLFIKTCEFGFEELGYITGQIKKL